MKKKQKVVVILVAVAVALGGGWVLYKRATKNSAVTYREAVIERGDLDLAVQATGTVGPENRLVVKPQVTGRIDEALVDEGQRVKSGQVMALMSSSDRAALIDMARAKGAEEVRHWEEIYKPTPIVAPLAGVVIAKSIEPGQSVSTGDTAFVISDRLIVTAQVDETDLARIRMNQKVELRLDAYADKPLTGKVIRIAYEAKTVNNVTVYEIRVLPDDVPEFMRAGMTVSVKFLETSRHDVVLVPIMYVVREPGASGGLNPGPANVLVKRADAGKKVVPQERPVVLGINDGRMAEVLSGLVDKEIVLSEEKNSGDETKKGGNPFMPKRPAKKKDGK